MGMVVSDDEILIMQRIQATASEKGLKVSRLSALMGCSPACLGNYLRGERRMPMSVFLQACEALGVTPNYLLLEADDFDFELLELAERYDCQVIFKDEEARSYNEAT